MIEFTYDDGGLKDLQKKLENLPKEQSVTFDKLFPALFMTKYTDLASIQAFIDALIEEPGATDDFNSVSDAIKDSFVDKHTQFSTWDEMVSKATEDWTLKQLGL